MRQAITTRYRGPTHSGPAKYLARAWGGSHSTTRDYDLSTDQQHCEAARRLALKLGWAGLWVAGGSPEGTGSVYVLMTDRPYLPFNGSKVKLSYVMGELGVGKEGEDWFYVSPQEVSHDK